MTVVTERIELRTPGEVQIVDVTDAVSAAVAGSGLRSGIACVFNPGSTPSAPPDPRGSGRR